MNEMTITDANFEAEVLKSDLPVLVDFWAPWCGPCRALGPVISELAEEFAGRVKVGKLNTDENPAAAQALRISSIPTVMIFKDGKLLGHAVGVRPKSELQAALLKATI